MTVKQFFNSTAFKSIVVLLCIVLVCGTILAIANDLFYVSDEELLQRAISKVYGEKVEAVKQDIKQSDAVANYGIVNEVYHIPSDGNYLLKVTGKDGFNGGTVTLWIKADFKGEKQFGGIGKVVVDSSAKQTFMSKFSKDFYEEYTKHNDKITGDFLFNNSSGDKQIGNITSGATYSSNAHNNAVNAALLYIKIVICEQNVQILPYQKEVSNVKFNIEQNVIKYSLTSGVISMNVDVKDGKVEYFKITMDNTSPGYEGGVFDKAQLDKFVGMNLAQLEGIESGVIHTGSSLTNNAILNCLKYATANYEHFLNGGQL